MTQGYVKLYRAILENELFENDKTALMVFIHLLLLADRETGQYKTSKRMLSNIVKLKESTLFYVLKRLEDADMIECRVVNGHSIINLCNWKKYQHTDNSIETVENLGKSSGKLQKSIETPLKLDRNSIDHEDEQNNLSYLRENKNSIETPLKLDRCAIDQEQEIRSNIITNVIGENTPDDENQKSDKKPNEEINALFALWEKSVGKAIVSNVKKNRFACHNLVKRYGIEGMEKLIATVAVSTNDPYSPMIFDFVSLQAKQSALDVWIKKKKAQAQEKAQLVTPQKTISHYKLMTARNMVEKTEVETNGKGYEKYKKMREKLWREKGSSA